MKQFSVAGKTVSVFTEGVEGPVVCLNTFAEEGGRVYRLLLDAGCRNFSLVAVSGLDWNCDMAPWEIPPIAKDDTPCTGGADEYLRLLTEQILPAAEREIAGAVTWRGIAGYSLAGLFALYALYQTECFTRAASVSGSLWYPQFKEYVFSHAFRRRPDRLYFSLGDRESDTKNPFLKPVQENTEQICAYFEKSGIETVFRLNPGNHFQNGDKRTAAGIAWLLEGQAYGG